MEYETAVVYGHAAALGAVTGLRSMTAPATLAWSAQQGDLAVDKHLAWLGSTTSVAAWSTLALGELVADKLPQAPSRLALVPFTARLVLGALAGHVVARASNQCGWAGAAAGAAGAALGTWVGHAFRTRTVQAIGGPDWPVAIAEDSLALVAGIYLSH